MFNFSNRTNVIGTTISIIGIAFSCLAVFNLIDNHVVTGIMNGDAGWPDSRWISILIGGVLATVLGYWYKHNHPVAAHLCTLIVMVVGHIASDLHTYSYTVPQIFWLVIALALAITTVQWTLFLAFFQIMLSIAYFGFQQSVWMKPLSVLTAVSILALMILGRELHAHEPQKRRHVREYDSIHDKL